MTFTTFSPSSYLRAGLMVPVVVASLWALRAPTDRMTATAFEFAPSASAQPTSFQKNEDDSVVANENLSPLEARKVRISQLLDTLDQIASVTQQMAPERAAALEPVLVDLAERTLDLSDAKNIEKATADIRLTKLEATVEKLVRSLNRSVAPEVSL